MIDLSQNLSRLKLELPSREGRYSHRLAFQNVNTLKEALDSGGYEWPKTASLDKGVKCLLSEVVDASVLRVYNQAVEHIQSTEEHKHNYKELNAAGKTCGGFRPKTAILSKANPFEQMVAFDQFIDLKSASWTKGRRTYCFHTGDGKAVIPLYVASTAKTRATTMTTMIGAGTGVMKAPKYVEIAKNPGACLHPFNGFPRSLRSRTSALFFRSDFP